MVYTHFSFDMSPNSLRQGTATEHSAPDDELTDDEIICKVSALQQSESDSDEDTPDRLQLPTQHIANTLPLFSNVYKKLEACRDASILSHTKGEYGARKRS